VIHLSLPEPPSANRYWRVFRGRAVKSAEARAYVDIVKYHAAMQRVKAPISGDVILTVVWRRQRRAGDLDNRLKCLLDALKGIAFADDKQVKRIVAERFDRLDPAGTMEVTVVQHQEEAA
jgi:crossover junction endodeoxyribonuclease RusA